ncbi:MAG: ABATE domain-containing protein, partial [Acetobacteraceae bacterium]
MGRLPAIFVGDACGLDFLNSIATPADTPIDWLEDGQGLLSWLEQARLAPADELKSIGANALPGELDNVASQARRLREWFRGFVREHKGRALAAGDLAQLEPLNRLLERDASFSRIVSRPAGEGEPLQLQLVRRWQTPEA